MKRQSTEWEKILGNEVTDKGLITKIYKQQMQLCVKTKMQSKNWVDLYRHFSKELIQMAQSTQKDVQHR